MLGWILIIAALLVAVMVFRYAFTAGEHHSIKKLYVGLAVFMILYVSGLAIQEDESRPRDIGFVTQVEYTDNGIYLVELDNATWYMCQGVCDSVEVNDTVTFKVQRERGPDTVLRVE